MTDAPHEHCEAIRIAAMARLDCDTTPDMPDVDAHLSRCDGCLQFVTALRALHGQLETLPYAPAPVDVWPTLAGRIGAAPSRRAAADSKALALLGGLAICWRAAQLLVDLPFAPLHLLVPLVVVMAVIRRFGDLLAIDTFIPELHELQSSQGRRLMDFEQFGIRSRTAARIRNRGSAPGFPELRQPRGPGEGDPRDRAGSQGAERQSGATIGRASTVGADRHRHRFDARASGDRRDRSEPRSADETLSCPSSHVRSPMTEGSWR